MHTFTIELPEFAAGSHRWGPGGRSTVLPMLCPCCPVSYQTRHVIYSFQALACTMSSDCIRLQLSLGFSLPDKCQPAVLADVPSLEGQWHPTCAAEVTGRHNLSPGSMDVHGASETFPPPSSPRAGIVTLRLSLPLNFSANPTCHVLSVLTIPKFHAPLGERANKIVRPRMFFTFRPLRRPR